MLSVLLTRLGCNRSLQRRADLYVYLNKHVIMMEMDKPATHSLQRGLPGVLYMLPRIHSMMERNCNLTV